MIKILGYIIVIVLAGLWGWFQAQIFPMETYGYFSVLTAGVGGFIIGYVGAFIVNKIFPN